MQHRLTQFPVWLVAAALLGAAMPSYAQQTPNQPVDVANATNPAIEAYIRARTAFEQEAEAYWQSIAGFVAVATSTGWFGDCCATNGMVVPSRAAATSQTGNCRVNMWFICSDGPQNRDHR